MTQRTRSPYSEIKVKAQAEVKLWLDPNVWLDLLPYSFSGSYIQKWLSYDNFKNFDLQWELQLKLLEWIPVNEFSEF